MMSLLPSEPDPEVEAGPRVIGVDSDDAEDVLAALSSKTARELLSALHEDPAPPSRLADRVDTSLQNAQYHLEKLETAGAVEVVDTAYSEKGREMDVYAPADQPLVIFAGDEGESTLRSALSRLLGAVGALAVVSLAVQALFGRGSLLPSLGAGGGDGAGLEAGGGDGGGDGGGSGGGDGAAIADTTDTETATTTASEGDAGIQSVETVTETATGTATEVMTTADEAVRTGAEAAAGLPPGLLFFAGGLVAIALVAVVLSRG
jgi:DNA-binding transcriptional ArsR family regulator